MPEPKSKPTKPRFAVGDVVDWDAEYVKKKMADPQEYFSMPGPYVVIRSGASIHTEGRFVVSLMRQGDGFEPTHNGTGPHGEPAPYGGNNWTEKFFKKNEFLTAVHQRRKHGV